MCETLSPSKKISVATETTEDGVGTEKNMTALKKNGAPKEKNVDKDCPACKAEKAMK